MTAPSLSASNPPLVFASMLAPRLYPRYTAAAAIIESATGRPVSLLKHADPSHLLGDEIDGAFVCGLPYTKLRMQDDHLEALVAPIPPGARYQGQPVYFADLVLRIDADIQTFAELAGTRFAFNEQVSHSGYNMVMIELARRGLDFSFFGKMIESGNHEASLDMVRAGVADIAAIDSQLLDAIVAEEPLIVKETRVLASLGPWPIPPFVATARMSQPERAAIRAAFTQMPGWTPVLDEHYDMLRA